MGQVLRQGSRYEALKMDKFMKFSRFLNMDCYNFKNMQIL